MLALRRSPAPPDRPRPHPGGLGVSGPARLELATCLSCLGWERQPLFYRHGEDGRPENIGYDGPGVRPQFPVGPLRESEVRLAATPAAGAGRTGR